MALSIYYRALFLPLCELSNALLQLLAMAPHTPALPSLCACSVLLNDALLVDQPHAKTCPAITILRLFKPSI